MYEWMTVMRRCILGQGSSAYRQLRASSRSYISEPSVGQGTISNVALSGSSPNASAQDVATEETASDFHTSSDGSNEAPKQNIRPVRRPLPLSPLMDPSYLAAKQRHRLPKEPPSKHPTSFQQQLAKNIYAQALATPIRMCTLTKTWLPSYFLQDFQLIAHPTTGEPWYLPRSLTSPYSSSSISSPPVTESATSDGTHHGPRTYTLSRLSLLKGTLEKKSGYTKGYERFPSPRSQQWKSFRSSKIRWRGDIDMFVLELMRRRVAEGLKYICDRKKGYLVPCGEGWGRVQKSKQVGALLWLGRKGGESCGVDIEERPLVKAERRDKKQVCCAGDGPGEFATWDLDKQMKSKIPVHNLQALLGEAHVNELRRASEAIFSYELVALKSRRTTMDVQLRLWKLQGFLAKHQHVDGVKTDISLAA